LSFPYFSRAAEMGFDLLNLPGVYTRYPLGGSACPSVLDLSFASPALIPFCRAWETPLPSTGSDHVPIQILLAHPVSNPPPPSPNWSLTDWPTLTPLLESHTVPNAPAFPTKNSLEAWFDTQLAKVTALIASHTPLLRPSPRSNPWWSPLLLILRREFHCASRTARLSHSVEARAIAKLSKQGYFKAIKAAKAAHWKSLLVSTTPRSIWTVKKLAFGKSPPRFPSLPEASTPLEMNSALLQHFFPPR